MFEITNKPVYQDPKDNVLRCFEWVSLFMRLFSALCRQRVPLLDEIMTDDKSEKQVMASIECPGNFEDEAKAVVKDQSDQRRE